MVGNKKQGHGLFEIVNSVAYHGKDVTETDSDDGINYITRSKFNNGLKARVVRLDKFKVNPAGTISFGAENADFFYQTEPYITGNKMYYIDTTALSVRACRFLKSIMEATFTANYSFSDGMIPARIYDECIKLPATPDGAPDWAYMESYMANIETKVAESLTMLQAAKDAEKKKVDTREWGEFRVGELFVQERGKEKAPKQNEPGDCPLIQETNNNNGFDRMVVPTKVIKGNSITVSINYAQNVFYQADDFCASVNIAVLRNNHLNRYNSQFVCSVLRNAHQKFDYTSKISKELLNKEMIMLPVDKTGQPDWGYMEEYMRKVERKTEGMLNQFIST